ncbi:MAG: TrmH family RNA methyltransferase [Streptococcus sp.]
MEIIQSKQNASIKSARKLLQRKHRKTSYLLEGWHLFEEAKASGAEILQVFVLEEMADRVANMSKVKLVSPEVLKELCETQTPQGIVVEVAKQSQALPDLSQEILLLDDVQDPGNVGTMIRTADAAGYDGVFLSDKSADIYNQKTLRSMQGSHFHLPIYRGPILDMVEACRKQGIPVLATTLSDVSVDYKAVKTDGNFALVMGNEGQGISQEMAESADQLVHISMPGQAESLNVAVAAGILMFSL